MKIQEIKRLYYIIKVFFIYGIDEIIKKKYLKIIIFLFKYTIFFTIKKNENRSIGFRLKKSLEKLGPVWIKFGQMLSTRLDLLPKKISKYLLLLQDNVTPFEGIQAIKKIEKSLGCSINKYFFDFNIKPLASASISQVHTAFLKKNKQPIIIKVIRPDILRKIKKDIKLMYFLSYWINLLFKKLRRFRFLDIVSDYEKILLKEINLLNEVKNIKIFRKNFKNSKIIYFPKIYYNFCSNSIIVMERIYGIPISDISGLIKHGINMKNLAETGVKIFFTQVFRDSFFHADMHPGNIFIDYKYKKYPRYIGIDCGIIGVLNKKDKKYLAENFIAFFNRNYLKIAKLHIDSGWISANTNIRDLELAIYKVCDPIFKKPLSDISFGMLLLKLFSITKRFNMQVQPQLILLQKTLFYIEGMGRQLYPKLDLWKTAKPFLEKWIKEQISICNLIKDKIPLDINYLLYPSKSLNINISKKIKYFLKKQKYIKLKNNKKKKLYYFLFLLIIIDIFYNIYSFSILEKIIFMFFTIFIFNKYVLD